jgi:hypothetical protein
VAINVTNFWKLIPEDPFQIDDPYFTTFATHVSALFTIAATTIKFTSKTRQVRMPAVKYNIVTQLDKTDS